MICGKILYDADAGLDCLWIGGIVHQGDQWQQDGNLQQAIDALGARIWLRDVGLFVGSGASYRPQPEQLCLRLGQLGTDLINVA